MALRQEQAGEAVLRRCLCIAANHRHDRSEPLTTQLEQHLRHLGCITKQSSSTPPHSRSDPKIAKNLNQHCSFAVNYVQQSAGKSQLSSICTAFVPEGPQNLLVCQPAGVLVGPSAALNSAGAAISESSLLPAPPVLDPFLSAHLTGIGVPCTVVARHCALLRAAACCSVATRRLQKPSNFSSWACVDGTHVQRTSAFPQLFA